MNNQQNATPTVSTQSVVGTLGLVNPQNINVLQGQLTPQQIAALQQQQGVAQQQLGVRPVVNIVGNQVIGGQSYALASNLPGGAGVTNTDISSQMQIRSLAPNAAAVVNQLNASQLQQVRAASNLQQARVQNISKKTYPTTQNVTVNSTSQQGKSVQQVNLSLQLQGNTSSPAATPATATRHNQILSKRKLHDLLHEIDPSEALDDDVEEILLQIADDFIENVINTSCQIAKHRKSNALEAKDVQLHLDRNWNMWIPGFGSEDLRPYKKLPSTEAHRQRLALIKKAMKK